MSCPLVLLGIGEVPERAAEGVAQISSECETCLLGLEVFVLDVLEVEVVELEAGGEDVILVDILDERLHAGLLDKLLIAVSALGLRDVPGDASDEQVWEPVFLHGGGSTLLPSS